MFLGADLKVCTRFLKLGVIGHQLLINFANCAVRRKNRALNLKVCTRFLKLGIIALNLTVHIRFLKLGVIGHQFTQFDGTYPLLEIRALCKFSEPSQNRGLNNVLLNFLIVSLDYCGFIRVMCAAQRENFSSHRRIYGRSGSVHLRAFSFLINCLFIAPWKFSQSARNERVEQCFAEFLIYSFFSMAFGKFSEAGQNRRYILSFPWRYENLASQLKTGKQYHILLDLRYAFSVSCHYENLANQLESSGLGVVSLYYCGFICAVCSAQRENFSSHR
uniref:Uncharacterized protein n=1 Tax=Onchocerca volvulus TaxID=6282 RepID=A0A8R1TN19_ONCVO